MEKTDKKVKNIPPKKDAAKKVDAKKVDAKKVDAKKADSKKVDVNKPAAPAPLVNCSRTSNFAAYRSPYSAQRMITHAPLLIMILILFVSFTKSLYRSVLKFIEKNILVFINPLIETFLEEKFKGQDFNIAIDAPSLYTILVGFILLFMLFGWFNLLKEEVERMHEAEKICYYFFDDIIAFYTESNKEQFRTINGIVSVKVTPAVSTKIIHVIMTVFASLITFNSKPIWQMIHGFRDVIIVPLGNPSETIILHDVRDPDKLVKNIKKHYPMCNVEGFGNSFSLK